MFGSILRTGHFFYMLAPRWVGHFGILAAGRHGEKPNTGEGKLSAKTATYTYSSILGSEMSPLGFIWSFPLSSLEEFVETKRISIAIRIFFKRDKLGEHSK